MLWLRVLFQSIASQWLPGCSFKSDLIWIDDVSSYYVYITNMLMISCLIKFVSS